MIELVMFVCLMDRPADCHDVRLTFENPYGERRVTPQQCMQDGQVEMSKWIGDHPNFVIKKWRCGNAGEREDI